MYGTYCRLNVHVNATALTVIRAASKKLRKSFRNDNTKRADRHAFYRAMLHQHRMAQDLYREFRF